MVLVFAAFNWVSCQKESETLLTKEYTIRMTADSTYQFELPVDTDDPFQIGTQALHASVSQLGVDANGKGLYTYKPDTAYVGEDLVILNTVEESHSGQPQHGAGPGPKPKGRCSESEYDYKITIRFVIDPVTR